MRQSQTKRRIILNKILMFCSALLLLLTGSMTACTKTTEKPPSTPKQPEEKMGQVVIAEGVAPLPNQTSEIKQNEKEPNEKNEENENQQTQNNEKEDKNEKETKEYKKPPTTTEKPKTPPFLNRGETQLITKLKTVAEKASFFYENNGSRLTLLSKNAKLYNYSTASFVSIQDLQNNKILEDSFSDFECDILLLKGEDIHNIEPSASVSRNVGIFTAAKNTATNKVILCSPTGKIATISEENYNQLLKLYNASHGNIYKLSPQMEEYERILNFIRVYEGNYDKYYVRDIRVDKKYAVVTFSSQTAPSNVKQYILINRDGFWEVAIDNLALQSNLNYAINSVLPDFNFNLLPNYNVYFYKNDMKADFSDVLKYMVFHEMIEQQSQVQYICGTTNYCYIVLYGGEKYLGKKTSEQWDISKVKSAEDAIASMELDNVNAPTFIVLDE